jgi:hypothetical protein
MIRSLYNLKCIINTHINKLPINEKFNLKGIKPILKNYIGNDWYNYKISNSSNTTLSDNNDYQRIPIYFKDLDKFSYDQYDMYLLVWNPYCHTSIHSHPEGGCLMKILEGNIIEQRFKNAESFATIKTLAQNDMSYMHDSLGFHRIMNNNFKYAYSLHIYSPALLDDTIEIEEIKNNNVILKSKINFCQDNDNNNILIEHKKKDNNDYPIM